METLKIPDQEVYCNSMACRYAKKAILPLMDILGVPLTLTFKVMIFFAMSSYNYDSTGNFPLPFFMITNNQLSHNYLLTDM